MVRRYTERYPYKLLEATLASHTSTYDPKAKKAVNDTASKAILKFEADANKAKRRLFFSTLLLIGLLIVAQSVLDKTNITLSWADIPQTIQVINLDAGAQEHFSYWLPGGG